MMSPDERASIVRRLRKAADIVEFGGYVRVHEDGSMFEMPTEDGEPLVKNRFSLDYALLENQKEPYRAHLTRRI